MLHDEAPPFEKYDRILSPRRPQEPRPARPRPRPRSLRFWRSTMNEEATVVVTPQVEDRDGRLGADLKRPPACGRLARSVRSASADDVATSCQKCCEGQVSYSSGPSSREATVAKDIEASKATRAAAAAQDSPRRTFDSKRVKPLRLMSAKEIVAEMNLMEEMFNYWTD